MLLYPLKRGIHPSLQWMVGDGQSTFDLVYTMMFSAAIFDMDGLLIDSERMIMRACIAAAADIGVEYTQAQYADLIGRAHSDSTQRMTAQLGGEANFHAVMQGLDRYLAETGGVFPLRPGAHDVLAAFKQQNMLCGVASSSHRPTVEHRLAGVGVLSHFHALATGDEVARGKPNPDIFLLALSRLGVPAERCLAFEDSEMGARAAIAAGLKTVVVPDLNPPSDFVRQHAYAILDSLEEFMPWLQRETQC